jgi:hypothetical protein
MRLASPISSTLMPPLTRHPEEHPDRRSGIATKGAFFLRPKLKAIVLSVRVFILPYPIKIKTPLRPRFQRGWNNICF